MSEHKLVSCDHLNAGKRPGLLPRLIARICAALLVVVRRTSYNLKMLWLRLLFPSAYFGKRVEIALLARVMVADGGTLHIGDDSHISPSAMVRVNGGELRIGKNSFIGQGTVIAAAKQLVIGDDALIAENVTIRDQDHGSEPGQTYRSQAPKCCPLHIGNNVWLGAGVVVVKGVTIGDNVIVGAGSVVTRDVTANTVVAGSPARPLKVIHPRDPKA